MSAATVPASFSSKISTDSGDVCEITERELNIKEALQSVRHNNAGALAFFVGTTRDTFEGKGVIRLEYEAHTTLAIRTMTRIMEDIRSNQADLIRLACYHRIGVVPVGEPSIIVAVSAPHRKSSFEACERLLEEVKRKAPIWKREWYAGEDENEALWKENLPIQT